MPLNNSGRIDAMRDRRNGRPWSSQSHSCSCKKARGLSNCGATRSTAFQRPPRARHVLRTGLAIAREAEVEHTDGRARRRAAHSRGDGGRPLWGRSSQPRAEQALDRGFWLWFGTRLGIRQCADRARPTWRRACRRPRWLQFGRRGRAVGDRDRGFASGLLFQTLVGLSSACARSRIRLHRRCCVYLADRKGLQFEPILLRSERLAPCVVPMEIRLIGIGSPTASFEMENPTGL
jgi:hypothetical protein